jgi:hypothetical protein
LSLESRRTAGALLILMPTVVYGGASILSLLVGDPDYAQNALRQDLRRAGHAHAGVLLVLSLVTLRYVDEATLSKGMMRLARHSIPAAAILLPAAFFLSVVSPDAAQRAYLPGLRRRGLAGCGAPGPRGRPRPESPDLGRGVMRDGPRDLTRLAVRPRRRPAEAKQSLGLQTSRTPDFTVGQ